MSRSTMADSPVQSPLLSPTVIGDDELAAQVDQALSSRRHIHHSRHRSSISLSMFRSSHLRKTDSRTSSKHGDLTRNRSGDDHIDEGDSDGDEEVAEADSEDKKRRRLRRSKRTDPDIPPPIKLLVRKAEPAKPVDVKPSGLPLPRAQHVHFPSSDDHPEGSSSKLPSASFPDGEPEHSQTVGSSSKPHSSNAEESASGSLINLLAPRPEERHQAKAEVRKLKKGHAREYVWDVLFENQRGIMFMGTPHFSKSTLFPFDPNAYTVPIHALKPVRAFPTTDRSASSDPPPHNALKSRPFALNRRKRDQGGRDRHHHHDQHKDGKAHAYSELRHTLRRQEHEKKSMTTPYDLHTFQPPSSHWTWLTPWLVNMRQDGVTDERGWEYNYIFRKHGWGPNVAWSGWGGWVRRRMWVRLRSLKMNDAGEEEEDWQDDDASIDFVSDAFDLEQGDEEDGGERPSAIVDNGDEGSRHM